MAGIFQSFRTSAMPKRLLRYAMARFDIFEDDALDLENLDLGFGLRNTFEFKDVGLKVDVRRLLFPLILPLDFSPTPIQRARSRARIMRRARTRTTKRAMKPAMDGAWS